MEAAWSIWKHNTEAYGAMAASSWAANWLLDERVLRDMSALRTQLAELLADSGLLLTHQVGGRRGRRHSAAPPIHCVWC